MKLQTIRHFMIGINLPMATIHLPHFRPYFKEYKHLCLYTPKDFTPRDFASKDFTLYDFLE